MTGLERNSDIVMMASYAPLLVNVNPGGMQWETDLIGYNAMKSYGSPTYYAQVLFASYLGDHTLASKLENGRSKVLLLHPPQHGEEAALSEAGQRIVRSAAIADHDARSATESMAKLVRLSAPDTQTTNSIDDPNRLVPVESPLHDVSSKFSVTLPPYSIQVLQIDLQ